jgi:hypothetical protein
MKLEPLKGSLIESSLQNLAQSGREIELIRLIFNTKFLRIILYSISNFHISQFKY